MIKKTHFSIISLPPNHESRHIYLWLITHIPKFSRFVCNCSRKIIKNPGNPWQNKKVRQNGQTRIGFTCFWKRTLKFCNAMHAYSAQIGSSNLWSSWTLTKYSHVNLISIIDFRLESFGRSFIQFYSACNFAIFCLSHIKLMHRTQQLLTQSLNRLSKTSN